MQIAIVYMVAGLSSRFGGRAKGLIKINKEGETLLEYSLKQALKSGINKIILIVSNETYPLFKKEFGENYKGISIFYAFQNFDKEKREKPFGTADALCSAKELIDCPFIVCNGDDLYGEEAFQLLVNHLRKNSEEATLGYYLKKVLPEKGSVNRGIFDFKDEIMISLKETFNLSKENLKENNLTGEELCSMNIFALHPETIKKLEKKVNKFKEENKEDRKKECLLPKEINDLINEKEITMKIYPTSSKWFGVTNPEDEEKAWIELNKNKINQKI